jgi:hypothetical protein
LAEAVERLLCKLEALSSNSSPIKTKQNKTNSTLPDALREAVIQTLVGQDK